MEMGKEGASQKMMFAEIGINKGVADTWKKNHPEFADALDSAVTNAQAYWEREILANVNNKGFNSRLAEIALRGQFQQITTKPATLNSTLKWKLRSTFKRNRRSSYRPKRLVFYFFGKRGLTWPLFCISMYTS